MSCCTRRSQCNEKSSHKKAPRMVVGGREDRDAHACTWPRGVMRFKRRERRLAGPDKDVIVFAPAPTAHVEGP